MFDEKHRQIFLDAIKNTEDRANAKKFGELLAVIIRLMSQGDKVDVEIYEAMCKELYLHLVINLPWVSITKTLHKLLFHSPEMIRNNESRGLKEFNEEGLESKNKDLRFSRCRLSRKTSQQDNLTDHLHRLWIGSDPVVTKERYKGQPRCKKCFEVGHSVRGCKVGVDGS